MSSSGMKKVCCSRSTDPSPARIEKTFDHKNLQELGTEVTELLVETENFDQRERG
jgi:hypothetical protein